MLEFEKIDMSQFNRYAKDLAARLNVEIPDAIKAEAASVLKVAGGMQFRESAKPKQIRTDTRWREMKSLESDGLKITASKKNGKIWGSMDKINWILLGHHSLEKNFKFSKDGHKIAKKDWQRFWKLWQSSSKDTREKIRKALGSRGLGAKSWFDLVELLGFDAESLSPKQRGVSKALDAKTRKGSNPPRMGFVYDSGQNGKYKLTVGNTSVIAVNQKGKNHIQAAIRRRAAAFRNNVKNDIFKDADQVAARYPGIRSRLSP
ncbi:hypothetical protein J3R74_000928 [Puniceicoccus vermicola]